MAGSKRRGQRTGVVKLTAAYKSPEKNVLSPARLAQPAGLSVHSPVRKATTLLSPISAAKRNSPPHVAGTANRSPRATSQNGSPVHAAIQRSPRAGTFPPGSGRKSPRPAQAEELREVDLVAETL